MKITQWPKFVGHSKSSSKKEIHSSTGLPQETWNVTQSNLTPEELEKKKPNWVEEMEDQSGSK